MSGGLLTPQGQAWRSGSERKHNNLDASPFCTRCFPTGHVAGAIHATRHKSAINSLASNIITHIIPQYSRPHHITSLGPIISNRSLSEARRVLTFHVGRTPCKASCMLLCLPGFQLHGRPSSHPIMGGGPRGTPVGLHSLWEATCDALVNPATSDLSLVIHGALAVVLIVVVVVVGGRGGGS